MLAGRRAERTSGHAAVCESRAERSYIHEEYCPQGGGEQQNSLRELMGVFGPRVADDSPPQITDIQPANGSVFGTSDDITITAAISDNSGMVGVKWTWLEGVPEGDSDTKCTNKVCDADFNPGVSFDASSIPWDFVAFDGTPAGTYSFQLEVMDAYAFEVMEQAGDDDDDDSDDDDDMSDGTGGGVSDRGCRVTPVGSLTGMGPRGAALLGLLLMVVGRRRSARA